jgi:hypothetical protein
MLYVDGSTMSSHSCSASSFASSCVSVGSELGTSGTSTWATAASSDTVVGTKCTIDSGGSLLSSLLSAHARSSECSHAHRESTTAEMESSDTAGHH